MLSDSSINRLDRVVRSSRVLIAIDLPRVEGCDLSEFERISNDLDRMSGIVVVALTSPADRGHRSSDRPASAKERPESNAEFTRFLIRCMTGLRVDEVIHLGRDSPVVEACPDLDTFAVERPTGLALEPLPVGASPQEEIDAIVNLLHYIASIRTLTQLHSVA